MAKIKIVSNPYNREISYASYSEISNDWVDIKESGLNSRLREEENGKTFLPFKIKEIIDIIIELRYWKKRIRSLWTIRGDCFRRQGICLCLRDRSNFIKGKIKAATSKISPKLFKKSLPYVAFGYVGDLLSHAYRTSASSDATGRLMDTLGSLSQILTHPVPSLHYKDNLFGIATGIGINEIDKVEDDPMMGYSFRIHIKERIRARFGCIV